MPYGFALKSSLPCPGEEAPPRPKSLVGVGTWGATSGRAWPSEGGPGLRFPPRFGATQPSRLVGREAVVATEVPGCGHVPALRRGAPVDRPRAAVPSAARGVKALLAGARHWLGGHGRNRRPWLRSCSCATARGTRRPAPGCGCPTTAAWGDRLPACRSPVDRPCAAEGPLRGTR